jgi:molybdopterin converting factor small subunit
MKILLCLKSTLKKYSQEREFLNLEIKEKAKISDLIILSKIPPEEIGLILINGKIKKSKNPTLKEGDQITFYPKVAGG